MGTGTVGPGAFPIPAPRISASSGRPEHGHFSDARGVPVDTGDDDGGGSGSEHDHEHDHDGNGQAGGDSEMGEIVEDAHYALTTQSLNSDGTPRRPMNAFMIFARRRRPQVSAANQMMRTGEISKILSKEWNSMPMSEKQFYLDQAKKLKDNFNMKYPDYVYRRRPNNSRKKRRGDGSVGSRAGHDAGAGGSGMSPVGDHQAQDHDHDHERDDSGSTEFGADSPIDMHNMSSLSPHQHGSMGYSDAGAIVVHPPHPQLSLSGIAGLTGPSGSSGGAASNNSHFPGGGLAPPHIYTRPPFAPPPSATSTSEQSSALSPLSPISPYDPSPASASSQSHTHFSPYSPATSFASSYSHNYSSGAGTGASGDDFNSASAYHAHNSASGRLSHLGDWPSAQSSAMGQPAHSPVMHHQQHSAYPHSPEDQPPFFGSLGRPGGGTASNPNAAGGGWPMSSLSAPNRTRGSALPPLSGVGGLNLNLGVSPSGGNQGQNRDIYSPVHQHRERAWSTTPSSASGSSASATSPGTGAGAGAGTGLTFPTLTEAYRPGQHQQHNQASTGRSASTSPTLGVALGRGDLFEQSQPHSAYPISSRSATHLFPPPHQGQGQGQGQRGPAALLHPISTFGTGTGAGGRDVSPLSAVSPHSSVSHHGGGGGFWSGDRPPEGQ